MADANARPIYALPLTVPSYLTSKIHGKRKRSQVIQHEHEEESRSDSNTEYSAVITPDERAQRRLAGQSLDRPPPPAPFPHAPYSRTSSVSEANSANVPGRLAPLYAGVPSSLRSQHIFAIAGLWGIGAEILIRESGATASNRVSRGGFEKAKILYDKLALQYPWHRSWPTVINAQDFKIAMFNLWIYTVCLESKRIEQQYVEQDDASLTPQHELQAKRWELDEADAISKEMDSLMGTVPFVDHLELIRLRAMVALWIANLITTVDLLGTDTESNNSLQEVGPQEQWSDDVGNNPDASTRKLNEKAVAARSLAKSLFVKLGIDDHNGTTVGDETDFDTEMVS